MSKHSQPLGGPPASSLPADPGECRPIRRLLPYLHNPQLDSGPADRVKIADIVEWKGPLTMPANEHQPFGHSLDECSANRPVPRPLMTSAVDRKTYWGVGEMVMWIRTRDHERVAAMSDLSETDAMVLALFTYRARLDPYSLPRLLVTNSDGDRQGPALQGNGRSSDLNEPSMMDPSQALDDLHRKVHSRRAEMAAIRCDGSSDEHIPVPPVELNDLVFRFVPEHAIAPVGLWSRSRGVLVWRSPQFLRANGLRVWPARNTKTAAVSGAILRHLCKITTSEASLTKSEAQRRCLAEVPNAYPEAFRKAWAELEPSRKRGRGKHGPRGR